MHTHVYLAIKRRFSHVCWTHKDRIVFAQKMKSAIEVAPLVKVLDEDVHPKSNRTGLHPKSNSTCIDVHLHPKKATNGCPLVRSLDLALLPALLLDLLTALLPVCALRFQIPLDDIVPQSSEQLGVWSMITFKM